MKHKKLFIEVISSFLSGSLSREEAARIIAMEVPIEHTYIDNPDLMVNCEWGLRHMNEKNFYTPEVELQYYLSCLTGDKEFSIEERDSLLKAI